MLFTVNFISYAGAYRTIQTDKLNVQTDDGRRTILSNHMPIMLVLEIGVIETSDGKKVSHYANSEGMLMFENNVATILCDEIMDVDDIDVERAQRSAEKAEQKINSATKEAEILRATITLQRAVNLINASKKYGQH